MLLLNGWLLLAALIVAYGFAWIGHFFIEGNKPATFRHPLWSVRGDLKMYGLMWQGRMLDEIRRHASPHRGSSVEFAEYRKYVPGDDLRRLDWRVFGRSDRFYVKEFEADTNLRCCFVLDTSGSMGFGSTGGTKIEYARKLAGSLGYLAVQQGDAVGVSWCRLCERPAMIGRDQRVSGLDMWTSVAQAG